MICSSLWCMFYVSALFKLKTLNCLKTNDNLISQGFWILPINRLDSTGINHRLSKKQQHVVNWLISLLKKLSCSILYEYHHTLLQSQQVAIIFNDQSIISFRLEDGWINFMWQLRFQSLAINQNTCIFYSFVRKCLLEFV